MKSLVFTISTICAFFFVGNCNGETGYNYKTLKLNTIVKSVQVKTYNIDNKSGEAVKGDLNNSCLALFDPDGNLTSFTTFDNNGNLLLKSVLNFNNKNRVTKYTSLNSDGDLTISYQYKYKGKYLSKIKSTLHSKQVFITKYKRDGEKILEYTNFADGEIIGKTKCIESRLGYTSYISYDGNGQELGITEYDDKNLLTKQIIETDITTFTYNNEGDLIKLSTSSYEGEIKYNEKNLPIYVKGGGIMTTITLDIILNPYYEANTYYVEYEYDDKGNWIKQTVYESETKKPYSISERIIEY